MAVNDANANTRPVRENLIESAAYLRDVHRPQVEPPEWLAVLGELVVLKKLI